MIWIKYQNLEVQKLVVFDNISTSCNMMTETLIQSTSAFIHLFYSFSWYEMLVNYIRNCEKCMKLGIHFWVILQGWECL
jgi:hypothetical protein